MSSVVSWVAQGVRWLPTIVPGLMVVKSVETFVKSIQPSESHLPDADAAARTVFDRILAECKLQLKDFHLKYDSASPLDQGGQAVAPNIVVCNPSVSGDLVGADSRKQAYAAGVIKHELGHLYHQHAMKDLLLNSLLAVGAVALNRAADSYLFSSSFFVGGNAWLTAGKVLVLVAQLGLVGGCSHSFKLRAEYQADAFAIQHGTRLELEEQAKKFESEVEKLVAQPTVNQFSGVTLQDRYDQGKKPGQTLREWVIENRYNLIPKLAHPNPWDRALVFRAAIAADCKSP